MCVSSYYIKFIEKKNTTERLEQQVLYLKLYFVAFINPTRFFFNILRKISRERDDDDEVEKQKGTGNDGVRDEPKNHPSITLCCFFPLRACSSVFVKTTSLCFLLTRNKSLEYTKSCEGGFVLSTELGQNNVFFFLLFISLIVVIFVCRICILE